MNVTNENPFDELRIPILLGIIGHRDLREQDKPQLRGILEKIFRDEQSKYPESPLILMSSLAEGSDRLAALTAIEAGLTLVCPLPFPLEEYRKDFHNKESQEEFETLLTKAKAWFVVPDENGMKLKQRADHYEAAGVYIARKAQIMIALWDGKTLDKIGGTSQIVQYRLQGLPRYSETEFRLLEAESGPILHVVTPRESNQTIQDQAFTIKTILPDNWIGNKKAEEHFTGILSSINEFNALALKELPSFKVQLVQSKEYLLPKKEYFSIGILAQELVDRYAIADVLANYYRNNRFIMLRLLFILVVTGFFFFKIYLEFWKSPFVLLLYPAMLTIGAMAYSYAKERKFEQRHEDFRALAEAIRVDAFWKLANIPEITSDHFLRKHYGQLDWIRAAISNWNIAAQLSSYQNDSSIEKMEISIKYWVEDQSKWFTKKGEENFEMAEQKESGANRLFILGMAIAVAMFSLHFIESEWIGISEHTMEIIHKVMVILLELCLVISASIHGYVEKRAFSEQAKNYSRMGSLFRLAKKELEMIRSTKDRARERKILIELGKESLAETGDWLLLHRSRPMEAPKG